GKTWADGLLSRVTALAHSPYARTLHIDTDTRLLAGDLPELFSPLDDVDVGMVEEAPDKSYSRKHSGLRMFNGGMMLFRRGEKMLALLEEWRRLTLRNILAAEQDPLPEIPLIAHVEDLVVRRKLLRNDQISLVEILNPTHNAFGLKVASLDPGWNYRGSRD